MQAAPLAREFLAGLPPPTLLELATRRMEALAARKRAMAHPSTPDPAQWIASCVTLEDPQAGGKATIIPFTLWPAQQEALQLLISQSQVIVLKARQLGLSWLIDAYATWLLLHHSNRVVLCFSKDQDSANEIIRRVRGMHNRLDAARKPARLVVDNVTTLEWDNGSRIKSFAATEDAGSSFTASLIIVEEFAKMYYAEALYTSVKPTINDGGKIVVVSTAKGQDNPFHRLWQAAVAGQNNLHPLFIPWSARPGRDADWYARAEADAISSAHHRQEYPGTPDEAFVEVAEERFLTSLLWWDACQEPLPPLARGDPLVLALDAGVAHDSFGVIGVTAHPTRRGSYAVRYARQWRPPKGGKLDFYADDGPDKEIRRLCREFSITQIEYDPWQLHSLTSQLMADGVVYCHEFNQQTMRPEADKNLLDMILAKRLSHAGDTDLRQHLDNADRKVDPASAIGADRKLRIVKRQESLKVDLAVTLSMALYGAMQLGL